MKKLFFLAAASLAISSASTGQLSVATTLNAANVEVVNPIANENVASGDNLKAVENKLSGNKAIITNDITENNSLSFTADTTLTIQSDSDTIRTITMSGGNSRFLFRS